MKDEREDDVKNRFHLTLGVTQKDEEETELNIEKDGNNEMMP